jgi:hypothetical protein
MFIELNEHYFYKYFAPDGAWTLVDLEAKSLTPTLAHREREFARF